MLILSFATIFIVIIGVLAWQANARARELASRIVERACKQHNVQWLDESTHLICWRLRRDSTGSLGVWREFEFEFLENNHRQKGKVTLLHHAVTDLQLTSQSDVSQAPLFQSANHVTNVIQFPGKAANEPSEKDTQD